MRTISNYTGSEYRVSEKHSISHNESGITWEKCDLKIGFFKWCPVYYSKIDNNIYIKPIKSELDANFEKIFGFGIGCQKL